MERIFNHYNSSIESLELENAKQEILDNFYDFLDNVPFIRYMVNPLRPTAKDLPRDESGKIIVDITKPHILEDMDYFRPSALHYIKYGTYTNLRPNPNPNSEFGKWIREETRRCFEGYVRPSDGEWVTGDYYFFLNYCPMLVSQKVDGTNKAIRTESFPSVWDGHYLMSHYLEQARNKGKQAAALSSRGRGKSYWGAGMLAKRFVLGVGKDGESRKRTSFILASDTSKLVAGDQTLDKFQYDIDFIKENMQWPSMRLTDALQKMQWKMGYVDLNTGTKKGTLNSVVGFSVVDEAKIRGSRGDLFLFEEAGSFPKLLSTYNNLIPSVKEGDNVYGQIFLYGCVCAGTIVYKDNGEPVKIEDVKLNDTLLGYNGNNTSVEHISWRNPEAYKECVEITTEGNKKIRCSIDHPLLAFNKKVFKSGSRLDKSCSFYLANELKVGDSLLMPKIIGTFGTYNEPDAYLLGALFGDGSFSGNQCVTLSICTEEEYAYYSSKYDLGISKLSKGDNTYAQLYFRKLHPLLKKYGMDKKAFGKKTFPNNIYEWDKESVCNFLGGYFNADGNVQITKVKHRTIKLTSKYEEHLLMVQSLLNKLGITSYILKEHKKASKLHSKTNNRIYEMKETDCFVLYINNSEDIITFRENIKFIIKKKQERLDSYNVNHNNTYNNIKFILRDNHKGKNFEGTSFNNIRKATIKSIKSIGIQRIYNMTADTTHTYISNNFISSNTSGDSDSDFQSMQEIMYNPEGYDVYGIDNVYDKEGFGKRKFTFFFPEYLNRAGCYDNNGNSDVTKALFEIISERVKVKYNSSDIRTILKTISDRPIVPQEAIMRVKGNFFPITDINNRIAQLDANPSEYDDVYIGKIIFNKDNKPEFQPTTDTPIRDFPLKNENTKGAIEIFKLPEKDANGNVFNNRYIAGLDPIDDDSSNDSLHSLMSLFVLDLWTDSIVCEYTGRLEFADDQYEIIRKILLFFNARCLYENNKKGIYAYFAKMNSLYLLEETPEFLKEKDMIKTVGIGNKAVGFSANKAVNDYADRCTRNWLMQPVTIISEVDGKEVESTVYKLYTVKNRAFLRECSLFNPDINVDRIRAFGALMLSREQHLIYNNGELKRNEDKVEKDYLGNDDYFTNNYDRRNSIK